MDFLINELDKANSGKGTGNPADVLLTLLDNLGFTDNYIRVEMDHDDQLDNQLIRVRMGGFNEEGTALKGVLV